MSNCARLEEIKNLSKGIDDIIKNQREILEIKSLRTESKN
jgi:hypothetical protein